MPSNDKKNKKRKNSNMTGLVTLIAWALFFDRYHQLYGQLLHAQQRCPFGKS